jgi:hypothetical protein
LVFHGTIENELPKELKTEALANFKKFSTSPRITSDKYFIIIDYRKDLFSKRLWLYDVKNDDILMNTHVTHALNSGLIYCNKTSNKSGSELSATGSFATGEKYVGNYGRSMRIRGLEQTNSNAFKRAIVFHPNNVKYKGFKIPSWIALYSKGCFALNDKLLDQIIAKTRNGSFIFVKSE